jgi:serine/threonine protein kinase
MSSFGSSDDGTTTASRFAPTEETELYCPACDQSFSIDAQHCPNDGTRLVRLSDVRDPLIGRNLEGRFLIKERLGTGGMGAVYRAWQGSVGREVAVKVIESRMKGGRLASKRFLREAKLASRLSHPNTVGVIDFGQTEDGLLYLVMELVKGRTMGDALLEDGPFPVDRMVRIGLQLCDALQAAHKLSIIHRDLKPSNVIVLDDPPGRDHVKVLDFGLAKSLVDEGMTTVTQSDAIMGTPSYIPPEAVTKMQFDERSDLYSLGVILYEVIAGRLPFDATTVQAMLRQHAYDRPKPLPENVPPLVGELLFQLLEKEPDRRPQSAVAVHELLLELTSMPERGTPLPVSRRAASQPSSFPTPNTPATAAAPGLDQTVSLVRRGRPWIILGIVGVALSGAAVLIASGAFDRAEHDANSASQPTQQLAVPPEPAPEPAERAAPAPAAALPAEVGVDLESDPVGAEIVIDGQVVGKTPVNRRFPRSKTPITVEFRRSGFKSQSKELVPDAEKRLSVSLDRIADRKTTSAGKQASAKTGGKSSGKAGSGGKTGGKTGAGGKSGSTTDKPPSKPPVKFVP